MSAWGVEPRKNLPRGDEETIFCLLRTSRLTISVRWHIIMVILHQQGWCKLCRGVRMYKPHPCLIPYDELSEVEKDYDRHTSLETLKLIVKLGCKIVKE